ncbi:hypothetical protein BHE74_00022294 [Ensete ventricosum]|nr:hypothetical protein BHE74_00022294 [Ensete ventricosum]
MRTRAKEHDRGCYYRFLHDYGHDTEECYDLKNQIEDLIHHDHLDRFVRRDMIRVVGELDCFSAHIHLRELGKSADKADKVSVGKEIDSEECHSTIKANLSMVRKGRKCEATDSRAMGFVAPWYRGDKIVQSGICCVTTERVMQSSQRGMIRVAGELDCFSAHIRLRELGKSEDKAE